MGRQLRAGQAQGHARGELQGREGRLGARGRLQPRGPEPHLQQRPQQRLLQVAVEQGDGHPVAPGRAQVRQVGAQRGQEVHRGVYRVELPLAQGCQRHCQPAQQES